MSKFLICKLVVLLILVQSCRTVPLEQQLDNSLPTVGQVGAKNLPVDLAPIKSPYFKHNFTRPEFPNRTDSVVPGEGIQDKIDALAAQGGGVLILKNGHHLSGRIELKSNIHLLLQDNALLEFKSEIEDFLPVVFTRNEGVELFSLGACIYANGAENIAITGHGKILGPDKGSIRERIMTHDVIENIVDSKTPVEDRIYDGKTTDFIFPPALIAPINCNGLWIEGVSLERSAFWNVVPTYCEDVVIRGISIQSVGIQRGDGIDIESSRNVLVEYCTLNTGDDCIAIKAGRGYDGLRVNRPSENIVVRYCLTEQGHGGFTIGSETAGLAKNIYVHDCVFTGTDVGLRFKTRRPRGGGGENILFENIRMAVEKTALSWDMLGQAQHVGNQASRDFVMKPNALTPRFSKITFKNIYIERSRECIKVEGIPESPLEGVTLNRIYAKGKQFLSIHDAKDFSISNSVFTCQDISLDTTNVVSLKQDNVKLLAKEGLKN